MKLLRVPQGPLTLQVLPHDTLFQLRLPSFRLPRHRARHRADLRDERDDLRDGRETDVEDLELSAARPRGARRLERLGGRTKRRSCGV